MYPYNMLRNHGPSFHYTEKDFCKLPCINKVRFVQNSTIFFAFKDSANDMNTNAYKAAIHKVHDRSIYEPSNALPFYARDCGGGWVCFESR